MVLDFPFLYFRLETGSFPVHFLPEVKEPGATAGKAQQKTWGIPAGVAVGVALGDLQCSVLEAQSCHTDAGTVALLWTLITEVCILNS